MHTQVKIIARTTTGTTTREITLGGQWEVFVTSQRFQIAERQRFLDYLEIRGAPIALHVEIPPRYRGESSHTCEVYNRPVKQLRPRGRRLNHSLQIA